MTLVRIATVVEGQGEVAAMPVLLRRLAEQINPQLYVESPRPHRVARGTFLRAGGVENAVATLVEQVGPSAGILMVVDADDDCPAKLGPALVERARRTRSDVQTDAVTARREFERAPGVVTAWQPVGYSGLSRVGECDIHNASSKRSIGIGDEEDESIASASIKS